MKKRIDKRTLTGARRKPPRIFQCVDCGGIVVTSIGSARRCPGCSYLAPLLKYGKRHCRVINCADCGISLLTSHASQQRCRPCQRLHARWLQWLIVDHKRSYQLLRNNPKRWKKRLVRKRTAYQRLVRDPIRYAKYLQNKREWYMDRQAATQALLDNPTIVVDAVLAKLGGADVHVDK